MRYSIHPAGREPLVSGGRRVSRSAPRRTARSSIHLGNHSASFDADDSKAAILVELGTECLGVHTGEAAGEEGSNVLGFARYRNGSEAPSPLIELVRQPQLQAGGDRRGQGRVRGRRVHGGGVRRPGRTHRRPRWCGRSTTPRCASSTRAWPPPRTWTSPAGSASAIRDGPIERVERGGLAYHYDVTAALFEVYGTPAYAPARRAVVAKQRADRTAPDAPARRHPRPRLLHAAAGADGLAAAGRGRRRGAQDRAARHAARRCAATSRAGEARASTSRCSTAARRASPPT